MISEKQTQLTTRLAQAGTRYDKATGSISVPIYQTASFVHPGLGQSTGFDYSRSSNPTRLVLEETLAAADGGHRGFAFASGLAAIDAVLRLFVPGDKLVVTEDLYGGTYRLFERIYRPLGIEAVYVDTSDIASVQVALAIPGVRGVLIESPTNPILRIADIRVIATLARAWGIITIVDNTFLTPVLQRPIEQGADLVVYSATKYLAGHNDVVAGAVVTATPELSERIGFLQNASGGILGPQDSWLTLRGIKTLALRVERQQANAIAIATWLASHPRVRRVYYPGLPNHPGRGILLREKSGWGGMISFEVDDPARVPVILSTVKIFLFAESLGGVESLITYPSVQTHADIEEATRCRLGINDRLLRLSVGIEDVHDLLDDLETVL
ncbi:MAG: PLP-dependent aspartate aminotransferase family protein [bacterium]